MFLTPYETLKWAYQLHYYLCFRTHRRRTIFDSEPCRAALTDLIREISINHDYHLLEQKSYPTQLRCLLSLQPAQPIAKAIQTLKTNSSRELASAFDLSVPLWARGYLARSSGRVRTSTVRAYLEQQSEHHGYASRLLPPVYKYRTLNPTALTAGHASFDLSHHLVFSTQLRKGVFTTPSAKALTEYWLKVSAKRQFALDQVTVVPDHTHLMVRIVPKLSIEKVALSLLNNGQYFIGQHYPSAIN